MENLSLYKLKDLRDLDNRRRYLSGCIISSGDRHKIWITGLLCICEQQRTIFHEGMHTFLPSIENGKRGIAKLDKFLWSKLSRRQQHLFSKYILC